MTTNDNSSTGIIDSVRDTVNEAYSTTEVAANDAVDKADDAAAGAQDFVADKAGEAQDIAAEVSRTTTKNLNQAKDEAIGFSKLSADCMNDQAAKAAEYVANTASDTAAYFKTSNNEEKDP